MAVTPYSGSGYQAAFGSLSVDSTINDGDNSTGPDTTGTVNGTVSLTAVIDVGTLVSVASPSAYVGWEGGFSSQFEYSADGVSWSPYIGNIQLDNGGVFTLATDSAIGTHTGRYFRYSAQDIAISGHTSRVSIREFALSYSLPDGTFNVMFASGYRQAATTDGTATFTAGNTLAVSGSGTAAVSVTVDLGTATSVSNLTGIPGFANSATESLQYSLNGSSWTNLSVTAANSYAAGSGAYTQQYQSWAVTGGPVSMRFIRYSIQDTAIGTNTAQAGIGGFGPGPAASTVKVWNQGACTVGLQYKTTQTLKQQPCDSSAVGSTDYVYGPVQYQYVSGGTGNLAQAESMGNAPLYRWVTVNDAYTFGNLNCYVGYFPNTGSDWYRQALVTGSDIQVFDRIDGLVTYQGWRNNAVLGTVPSRAVGSTWRITTQRFVKTYANQTGPVGSPAAYRADITITTETYVGYVTLGAFTLPNCPAGTTTSITPQGWGDFQFTDTRGPQPHDLGYRYSRAPAPRASWWEVMPNPATLYSDADPKGGVPTRIQNWGVSGGSLTNLTITVPCDDVGTAANPGFFSVGANLANFDTSGNDVVAATQHDLTTDGPYIYPDSHSNLGVFGVFMVSSGSGCGSPPPSDTSADHVLLSADTFDGALNVLWVSPPGTWPGKLKTALHLGASKYIGNSMNGWQSTQTLESSNVAYSCGLVYMPDGRIYINYNKSGDPVQRYNDQRGTGANTDWSPTTTADENHISSGGRGQSQAWRFLAGPNSAGSDITFSQCRDGQGKTWTSKTTAKAITARGPLCGGVFTGDKYGLLYTQHSDGHIYWLTTQNPNSWSGTGTDTGKTGLVCGLTRHPSGRLVAVTQSSAGGSCSALWSNDAGATWTAVSLSITPTPPPVIVQDAGIIYIVYISSDAPAFIASTDAGATWT